MAHARLRGLLLCIFLGCASLAHCKAEEEKASGEEVKTYLFPILRYGPNNQKRDLRQLAALAKQLDCGLVLTGLFKHYKDVRAIRAAEEKEKERKKALAQQGEGGQGKQGEVGEQHHRHHHKGGKRRLRKAHHISNKGAKTVQGASSTDPTTTKAEIKPAAGTATAAATGSKVVAAAGKAVQRQVVNVSTASKKSSSKVEKGTKEGRSLQPERQAMQQQGLSGALAKIQSLMSFGGASKTGNDEPQETVAAGAEVQVEAATAPQPDQLGNTTGAMQPGTIAPVLDVAQSDNATDVTQPDTTAPVLDVAQSGNSSTQLMTMTDSISSISNSNHATMGDIELMPADNATAPLPGCFEYKYHFFMDFDKVLDRKLLTQWLPVMSVDELKATGWNGKIEAFMYRDAHGPDENSNNKWHMTKTLTATKTAMVDNYVRLPVKAPVKCKTGVIKSLKEMVKPFRVVAVLLFALDHTEFADYEMITGPEPKFHCQKLLWQSERLLRHAPWMQNVAKRYIQEQLGGGQFLAVHVRPYPDACLDVWKKANLNDNDINRECGSLKTLHKILSGKIMSALQQYKGMTRVFIMAHPAIRHNIQKVLAQAKITPYYLTEEILYPLAGCMDTTATFMALAEEEVAVQASAFMGTATSSITQSIVVERLGAGFLNISYLDSGMKV